MIKKVTILFLFAFCLNSVSQAQNFNMGNLGTISNACGGNFYDSGGPGPGAGGNYGNNQSFVVTFCAPAGQYISFNFTQFNTEPFFDDLTIYNGPNTGSPLIGVYSGTNSPGIVTSTLGGCLTFEFNSDFSNVAAGWAATITCSTTPPSTGNNCGSASPFCTGTTYTFPNNTNVPDLGVINCLMTTPNPVWYYMEILTPGNLDINIAQTNGGGTGIDVDFNLWGPFTSLPDGCAQISAGTAPNVDCSYSTSATEQANIPNALAGEFYILLLTNYSKQNGTITFTNTAGSVATTNCDLLCIITDVTAIPTACVVATNTYSVSGQVFFTNAPTSGSLLLTSSCGGSVTINAPFTSPVNYTIPGLLPTGAGCSITASFTADPSCSFTQSYTSPPSCGSTGLNCPQYASVSTSPNVACGGQIYYLEVPNTGCNGTITFNVVGNYGSTYGNEITWEIISLQTGGVIASGGPGTSGANFNITVGPLNPAIVGTVFTLYVYDSFGDGFNGVGGTIAVQQPLGTNIAGPITGNFGVSTYIMFGANIAISPATITINTPTGPVVATVNNCKDFKVAVSFQNTNYCTTQLINVPWTIICQATGAVIASGSNNITVYPNLPGSAADLIDVNFDPGLCQWVVTPQSGCTLADIGSIFTITPNPATLTPPICGGVGTTFDVSYIGISGAPNCCSTGGALLPITYNESFTQPDFVPSVSPFWAGSNHSAYLVIPPYNAGGNANSLTLNISMTGYCFNQPGANNPPATSFWVFVIVDGQIIYSQQYLNPPNNFNLSLTLANIPGGYDETSVIEVYIMPNTFAVGASNTVFNPNAICPIPNAQDGQWTGNLSASISVGFNEMAPTQGICDYSTFLTSGCCTPVIVPDASATICSGGSLAALTTWINSVNTANANCIVFSSVLPVAGSVLPDNIFPNGINNGAVPIQQSVSAYTYCDSDGSGTINAGDTYTLISTFILTVNPVPLVVVPPISICNGQSGTLNASGALTYTWSPSTGLSASTGGTVTASPTISTTYTVTGTVSVGCSGTATSVVTVNPQPIVVVLPLIICNGQSGALTATGATTYTWSPSTGLSATTGATVNANPTTTTVYTVIGTAANGCTNSTTVTVTVNPIPSVTSALPSYSICSGPTLATASSPIINLFPNPAGTTIAWTGSDGSSGTGTPISYLIPNNTCADILITYTVTPTFNGCVGTPLIIPLIVRPKPIATFTVAPNPICVGQIAVVTFVGTACPGSTYAWTWPANVTVLSGTGAGPYTVNFAAAATYNISLQITGPVALGACLSPLVTVPVIVNPLPSIGIPFVSICNGQSVIVGANGASSYVWSPSTGLSVTTGASVLVNPTITTTYTIIGTSAVGCTAQTICIVTVNTAPILSTTFISPSCFGGANGSINLILTGGTAPFSYLWNTGALTEDLNGIGAGIYTVTVTSTGGCTVTTSVTVTQPTAISNSFVTTNILCNGASTGAIDLTPSGGVSLYSYLWSTGAVTQDLTNVVAGTYIVTVTDANGCTKQDGIILIQSLPVVINVPPATICSGQSGALTATGATTYTWSPSTGLSATTGATVNANPTITSTYTIIGTNVSGCTGTTTAVVTIYPLPIITPAHTDATCGNANGTASVSVSSGTPGFSYLWSNGSTLAAIGGLLAGNYSITVTDVNSCTSTVTISINNSGGPTLIPTPVPIACNGGNNGSVSITVSNGTTPFTYLWSNGATTQNISGLTAGSYSVTVTDANNCIATGTTNLTQPLPLLIILSPINVTCNGGINGSVSSTVSGGTPLYSYAWSNGATTTAINTLGSGTYSVTITDGNGCTATSTTTVIDPPTLDVSLLVVDPSCGLNNGSILVDAIVGVAGPYSYLWSNGETGIGITNLGPVSYSVTVTGANGCTGTEIALLVSTLPATATTSQVNVLCNGGATASIDLSVTGWLTFSYNWSNGTTTQDLLNLPVGVYAVTVTASNGCTATANATITQPTAIIPSSTSINTTCGNSNGSIDLTVSGGTPGYNYIWSNGATTQDITTIAAGTYTVTITDANGCTATTSATLTNAANPTANASATAVTCNGGTNGAVTLVVNSGTPPYTFNWSNGALTQNLANLVAGTYTVTVTDVNGCTVTTNATVTQPTAIPPSTTNVTICQNQLPYTWNTQILNSAGTYSVTLVNSSGCDSVAILNLTVTPLITPVFATPIGPFCQNSAAPVLPLISDNGINGTWNPSSINTASVGTSTYTFTPTVGQCAVPTSITITILPQIIPTFPPVSPLCFGDPSPILPTTSLEGITGTWSPSTVSNTATGTYVFTPDNPSQCGTTTIITVTVDPLPLTTPIYHD